jgi:hypothetical protein
VDGSAGRRLRAISVYEIKHFCRCRHENYPPPRDGCQERDQSTVRAASEPPSGSLARVSNRCRSREGPPFGTAVASRLERSRRPFGDGSHFGPLSMSRPYTTRTSCFLPSGSPTHQVLESSRCLPLGVDPSNRRAAAWRHDGPSRSVAGCPQSSSPGHSEALGRPRANTVLMTGRGDHPGYFAKLGRVRTFAGRGLPRRRNPRVGTPGQALRRPSSSCTIDRAQPRCPPRTGRRPRPGARRDRRSGRWPGGRRGRSPGTTCRTGRDAGRSPAR